MSLIWEPGRDDLERSNTAFFIRRLREERGVDVDGYRELQAWSAGDLEGFWTAVWDLFEVRAATPPTRILSGAMPRAHWFEGATLNLAEHLLRAPADSVALVWGDEAGGAGAMTFGELRAAVAACQQGLAALGVARGDRVAALLPNGPEAVVAFLATAGLGATWSCCAPEFGVRAVLDRLGQLEPKVLLAVDGYRYGGTLHDRSNELAQVREGLPSLAATVVLSSRDARDLPPGAMSWAGAFGASEAEGVPVFEAVPFDHPLWVVYTSGTTGMPKGIVHGHGGILLESLVQSSLHLDLGPGERFFWFTTTGWVMWNIVLGALSVGAAAVLYDGSPAHPGPEALWRFAERAGVTFFGTSAAFVQGSMKAGIVPSELADLAAVRQVGLTGSPLSPEGFDWIGKRVKPGVFIANISGGTDVCGALVGSSRLLPVYAGEVQGAALGARVAAYDEAGRPVVDEVGELVVTAPMPSMPVCLWNDPDFLRYHESYFDVYPGVWRHGDWVRFSADGRCTILGRSDSTLNRGGVRMGSSEFYRVVEEIPGVTDSLVVDLGQAGGEGRLLLFVVLAEGAALDDALRARILAEIRHELSPRHLPDEVLTVAEVPRTLSGKKLEVPVKRILLGGDPAALVQRDALANPSALDAFVDLARRGVAGAEAT